MAGGGGGFRMFRLGPLGFCVLYGCGSPLLVRSSVVLSCVVSLDVFWLSALGLVCWQPSQ